MITRTLSRACRVNIVVGRRCIGRIYKVLRATIHSCVQKFEFHCDEINTKCCAFFSQRAEIGIFRRNQIYLWRAEIEANHKCPLSERPIVLLIFCATSTIM